MLELLQYEAAENGLDTPLLTRRKLNGDSIFKRSVSAFCF